MVDQDGWTWITGGWKLVHSATDTWGNTQLTEVAECPYGWLVRESMFGVSGRPVSTPTLAFVPDPGGRWS